MTHGPGARLDDVSLSIRDRGAGDDDKERSRFLLLLLVLLVKRCIRGWSSHNATRPERRSPATDIVRLQLSPEPPLCPLRIRDKSHYDGRRHKMTTIAGREERAGSSANDDAR